MTRHVTRITLSVAAAGLALALAACGGTTTVSTTGSNSAGASTTTGSSTSSASPTSTTSAAAATPTVQGAVRQMNAGFAQVKSAHVVAEDLDGKDTIKIELAGTVDGKNQRGSISNSSATDGGVVQLVVVDGKEYVNGDAAYYKSSGNTKGSTYAGKWVVVPSTAAQSFSDLTLKSLFDEMESDFSDAKTTKMKLTTVSENGVPAWRIADSQTTGIIAADGSGHLMRAEHTEGGKTERYVFDRWNAVAPATAPAGAIQG